MGIIVGMKKTLPTAVPQPTERAQSAAPVQAKATKAKRKNVGLLTDIKIRNAKPEGKPRKISDVHGLCLEVFPNGSKLWRFRYRINGKPQTLALGAYPDVTLADARKAQGEARALVKQGVNPVHAKQARKATQTSEASNTFEGVAAEWVQARAAKWSKGYAKQVKDVMTHAVFKYIGARPIRSITSHDILSVVIRIEKVGIDRGAKATRKPRPAALTAINARQWCSAVFTHAIVTLRADSDPALAIVGAIEKPKTQHAKILQASEIPAFLSKVDTRGRRHTQIALRLMLLLFARTAELRQGEWVEFDLDKAIWRIPGEKMKMDEPHIVPLPRQAVTFLRELHAITGGGKWLFPNERRPNACMSATTLNRALESRGYGGRLTGHGFRGTASTILNERQYSADVIERQLAHRPINKTRASYDHATHLPAREGMLQDYADLIDSLEAGGNVVIGNFGKAA